MTLELDHLQTWDRLNGKVFLVCIGAAKCATSWLHHFLDSSPEAAVSPLKELHFFNAKFPHGAMGDVEALALSRLGFHMGQAGKDPHVLRTHPAFQASLDRAQMIYDDNAYFAHFARLCDGQTRCVADLTPAYSAMGSDGLGYMARFLATQKARPKILFVMRDPVARFWSQLRHLEQMNPANDAQSKWRQALENPALTARADYRATITALDRCFDPADTLYLFYETLFAEQSLRRLCGFADIRFDSTQAQPDVARNETAIRTPIPDDARAALRAFLDPQYAFCRDRFGADLPPDWLD